MADSTMWLLVADAGRAAVYAANTPIGPLQELHDFIDPTARLPERELVTDRPGRTFDSAGQGRHAMEAPTTATEREAREFASQLAELLDRARNEGRYRYLGLVASPGFLGLLRRALPTATARHVVLEVDKDLTRYDAEGIRERLPERLYSDLAL